MKKGISSVELAALVEELQILVKAKVSQIYHDEHEIFLQCHVSGKGKKLLRIVQGKFLCLTEKKSMPVRPSGLCMQLRKYLQNGVITSLKQQGSERIVVIEVDKGKRYKLIFELFSKGNAVFVDEDLKIIGVQQWQRWRDRVVKPGQVYVFPKPGLNWKEIDLQIMKEVLKKSEKKNLETCLATEIGLGGLYAGELLKRAGVENKVPTEVNIKEIEKIFTELDFVRNLVKNPKGYFYEEEITPFKLVGLEVKKEVETYNEAINTIKFNQVLSPYEQRIKNVNKILNKQNEAVQRLQEDIELYTKKGELIFEKYTDFANLLKIVEELKKTKSWSEIEQELSKQKIKLNKKNKRIIVNL